MSKNLDFSRSSFSCVHIGLCFAMVTCSLLAPARADEPLGPPEKVVKCSRTGLFCAESDPKTNRTSVRRRGSSTVLWAIDGWHRWMFVSNDGDSLVVAYDGMNLVPVDASMALEVLRFYHRGNLVRAVSLGDLYKDRSQLKRTISHLAWVRSIAVNGANQLDIELIGGSHKKISMK